MKLFKITLAVIMATLVLSCTSNSSGEKNGYTTITGIFDMPYKNEVTLSKIEHGKSFVIATSVLNANKEFGFNVKPEKEGFYEIGDKDIKVPMYLKGNQAFKISYNTDGYQLLNTPDSENEVLYKWVQKIDTLKMFDFKSGGRTTFKDFFPFYEKFIPEMKKEHNNVNTSNERFNELMHAYIDLKIEAVALNYLFTPRPMHPKKEEMAPFYKEFMKGDNFKTAIVLDIPGGISTLRTHQLNKALKSDLKIEPNNMKKWMVSDVENDKLRGYLGLEYIKTFKSYNEDYLNFVEPIRKDIAMSKYVTSEVEKFEVGIKSTGPGTQGYPFTYKDQHGKDVSFSDFKGKLVYIDVWATWCSPCKKQIPYIKQLEKELHGEAIQFVSISLDKPKDHEKWKQFIKDEELTGVQLFSDNAFNTRIAKDYKINAIPRFLLFDKEGKIVDSDAKRPSNPELKQQLIKLLKQG